VVGDADELPDAAALCMLRCAPSLCGSMIHRRWATFTLLSGKGVIGCTDFHLPNSFAK
jgi:hypothetical protein